MKPEDSHLLVVDDNEVNRDMLSRRFVRRGFSVDTASNGNQALEMIEAGAFDLVLLDIMMPGLNGIEVLKILRQKYSTTELPIIMATAKDRSEDVVEALELGANDYVTKPIDFPVVLARVTSHLKQKQAAQPKGNGGPSSSEIGPGAMLAEKYLIEDTIGSGAFGTVYRGKHTSLQQPVAVKVLQTNMAPASEALARFQREGISACRIKHPNAVSVLDFGITSTGVAYMIMELLEGRSLAEELKEVGILPPIRCAQILRPICDVLSEVHAAGMVHRDIKPANIYLHRGRAGEIVKVLDFGIAKLVGDVTNEEHLTVEGSILGTPTYMAPERFGNEDYDGRADVYSLGILLYRMLGGRTPFQSKDLVKVAMQHMRETPRSLCELSPQVTPEIDAVVMHALRKNMNDRPSARELAARFGQAVGQRVADRKQVEALRPAPPPPEANEPTHLIDSADVQTEIRREQDSEREAVSLAELAAKPLPATPSVSPSPADAPPAEETSAEETSDRREEDTTGDSTASSVRRIFDKIFDSE